MLIASISILWPAKLSAMLLIRTDIQLRVRMANFILRTRPMIMSTNSLMGLTVISDIIRINTSFDHTLAKINRYSKVFFGKSFRFILFPLKKSSPSFVPTFGDPNFQSVTHISSSLSGSNSNLVILKQDSKGPRFFAIFACVSNIYFSS